MKYLKKYKLFESAPTQDMVQTVKDILLELSDEGYDVEVITGNFYKKSGSSNSVKESIIVTINGKTVFKFTDISECVYRLQDWAREFNYIVKVSPITYISHEDPDYYSIDDFICNFYDEEEHNSIELMIHEK